MKPKRQDWLQRDAKGKLNCETDILEIIKKLRVHQFASEVALKPSQRDMVGFFDDYKLKTEADRKKDDKRAMTLAAKGTVIDQENDDSRATDEFINLDAGVKTGKQTERILRSVCRVNASNHRTDKIIIERVMNKNPRPRQEINIEDFLSGVDKLKDNRKSTGEQLFAFARQ